MRCSICSIKKRDPYPQPFAREGTRGMEVHGEDYKLTNILYFDFFLSTKVYKCRCNAVANTTFLPE